MKSLLEQYSNIQCIFCFCFVLFCLLIYFPNNNRNRVGRTGSRRTWQLSSFSNIIHIDHLVHGSVPCKTCLCLSFSFCKIKLIMSDQSTIYSQVKVAKQVPIGVITTILRNTILFRANCVFQPIVLKIDYFLWRKNKSITIIKIRVGELSIKTLVLSY